jgi:dolichyl-phosphate beta-glucosyltransferase
MGGSRPPGPAVPPGVPRSSCRGGRCVGASGGVLPIVAGSRLRVMPPSSLTVVLPAFNEAERLGPALDELYGYLRRRGTQARDGAPGSALLPEAIEILVVDDGSTDGTADLVRARPEAAANDVATLRLLTVPHGGKGAAVRSGMLEATSELVVFSDADMATPPDQIPLLVAALADHDIALGSRIQPDGSDMRATQPWYRRLLGKGFHWLASLWVVGPVQDTQCGFKGFSREAARDLFERQRIDSIVFDVELIFLARKRGYRLAIVPVRWADRRGSRMRARPGLAMQVAWDLFRIPLIHRGIGRRPATSAQSSQAASNARPAKEPTDG